jgi:hypothetical protein
MGNYIAQSYVRRMLNNQCPSGIYRFDRTRDKNISGCALSQICKAAFLKIEPANSFVECIRVLIKPKLDVNAANP